MDVCVPKRVRVAVMIVCLSIVGTVSAAIDDARVGALTHLIQNQQGDGAWQGDALGIATTATVVEALRNAGMQSSPMYASAMAWLANAEAGSTDSLARQMITLAGDGRDIDTFAQRLLEWGNSVSFSVGSTGRIGPSWGAYRHFQGSFPDTPLALQAIFEADVNYSDANAALAYLNGEQNGDGGWAYLKASTSTPASRVIPTAHSVIALVAARENGWGVDTQLGNGASWLKNRQLADGGFADDPAATNGSTYETALALRALEKAQALGAVSATTEIGQAQQFLVNTRATDGSWPGGLFATAAALAALPSASLTDTDQDGLPDAVETQLGSNPNVADSRDFIAGNGLSVTGFTTASMLDLGVKGDGVSGQFLPAGTNAVSWVLLSGNLPTGVTFNASTGELIGLTETAGTYNLTYRVTYADGSSETRVAQLTVANPPPAVRVPMLPPIGALILAALLAAFGAFQIRKKEPQRDL